MLVYNYIQEEEAIFMEKLSNKDLEKIYGGSSNKLWERVGEYAGKYSACRQKNWYIPGNPQYCMARAGY